MTTASEVVIGPLDTILSSSATMDDGDGDGGPGSAFGAGFINLIDTTPVSNEALIEDAVASGGDSTQWIDGDGDATDDAGDDRDDEEARPPPSGSGPSEGDEP